MSEVRKRKYEICKYIQTEKWKRKQLISYVKEENGKKKLYTDEKVTTKTSEKLRKKKKRAKTCT